MASRAPLAATLVFILHSCVLSAQNIAGTMEGIVVDDQHAVLPGVTITITNVDTGIARTMVTDGAGSYRAPALPPVWRLRTDGHPAHSVLRTRSWPASTTERSSGPPSTCRGRASAGTVAANPARTWRRFILSPP